MNWNLSNKKILITGGTKGIGRAAVRESVSLGAEVLFTARNKEEVNEFENELTDNGFTVKGIAGDIADSFHRSELIEWIREHWESVDVLVNNAGTNIRKSSMDFTEEELQRLLNINLVAPFELSKTLYPLLKKSSNASVINIASVAGTLDVKTGAPYAMTKAALIQQTKILASEWASDGIRVNAVSPWFTETPLTEGLLMNKERFQKVVERTPMKRIAHPEEMAAVIIFLAMDHSSYITGQNITADGGMSVTAL